MRRQTLTCVIGLGVLLGTLIVGCERNDNGETSGHDPRYWAGGEMTVFNQSSQAFSFPAPNISDLGRHLDGDANFDAVYVKAPAEIQAGLGPIYNHNSCGACHVSDGRGILHEGVQQEGALFLKLSRPGNDPVTGAPLPVPGFGGQLATAAVFGVQAEATLNIQYTEMVRAYGDSTSYSLRRPTYLVEAPYVTWPPDVMISPRGSLPVFGRGLLEAIPDAVLDSLSDPADLNQDSISGRVNLVWDASENRTRVGRFGWKAGNPSLRQQHAGAFSGDMGLTTSIFPQESSAEQPQQDSLSDDPEVPDRVLGDLTFYVQTLAVPAPRQLDDPEVERGSELFVQAKCSACHVPELRTGVFPDAPEAAFQTIRPYSDLLLHDMGDDLADGRPEFLADGREWRTPPLWGIGLTRVVQGQTFFLHDGRARTLEEAILWHGGEAEGAREFFRLLPAAERAALIRFLEAL